MEINRTELKYTDIKKDKVFEGGFHFCNYLPMLNVSVSF